MFINLTHDGSDFNVPAKRPNVTWMIHVDSPFVPKFKWLNQRGDEINVITNDKKYKMVTSKGYQQVMLVIYDVEVSDAGTYEFIAFYDNYTQTLNLTLIVRGKETLLVLIFVLKSV